MKIMAKVKNPYQNVMARVTNSCQNHGYNTNYNITTTDNTRPYLNN